MKAWVRGYYILMAIMDMGGAWHDVLPQSEFECDWPWIVMHDSACTSCCIYTVSDGRNSMYSIGS